MRLERRITIDIDCAALRSRAATAGVLEDDLDFLPIPLALLAKNLFLDMDVRDSQGGSLSLVTSDADAAAAQAVLLTLLENLEFDPAKMSETIVKRLFGVVRGMPSKHDLDALLFPAEAGETINAWALAPSDSEVEQSDERLWTSFFGNQEFRTQAAQFTAQFMPMIHLDTRQQHVTVVKFRYVETHSPDLRRSLLERLGFRAYFLAIEAPNVGQAAREHLRVVTPSGIALETMGLYRFFDQNVSHTQNRAPSNSDQHYSRVSPERGVLYTSRAAPGDYVVTSEIRAQSAGFMRLALLSVSVTTLMLLIGWLFQQRSQVFTLHANSVEPTVALLLAVPSLASTYLVRDDEHQLRSRLLDAPRLLVLGTVLCSMVAVGSLILDLSAYQVAAIWLGSAVFAGLVCLVLAILLGVTASSERRTLRSAHEFKSQITPGLYRRSFAEND